jgi:hypothetical protein
MKPAEVAVKPAEAGAPPAGLNAPSQAIAAAGALQARQAPDAAGRRQA